MWRSTVSGRSTPTRWRSGRVQGPAATRSRRQGGIGVSGVPLPSADGDPVEVEGRVPAGDLLGVEDVHLDAQLVELPGVLLDPSGVLRRVEEQEAGVAEPGLFAGDLRETSEHVDAVPGAAGQEGVRVVG